MIARGQIRWANLPAPVYRRPVCIVTRDSALPVLTTILCAPITTRIRGVDSEVAVPDHIRLKEASVINCDNIRPVDIHDLDMTAVGILDADSLRLLDRALMYALGIAA